MMVELSEGPRIDEERLLAFFSFSEFLCFLCSSASMSSFFLVT